MAGKISVSGVAKAPRTHTDYKASALTLSKLFAQLCQLLGEVLSSILIRVNLDFLVGTGGLLSTPYKVNEVFPHSFELAPTLLADPVLEFPGVGLRYVSRAQCCDFCGTYGK